MRLGLAKIKPLLGGFFLPGSRLRPCSRFVIVAEFVIPCWRFVLRPGLKCEELIRNGTDNDQLAGLPPWALALAEARFGPRSPGNPVSWPGPRCVAAMSDRKLSFVYSPEADRLTYPA